MEHMKEKNKDMPGCPYEKYEVEGWARAIMEAEEVKADPKKMKWVKPLLSTKLKALDAVKSSIGSMEELRETASKKREEMAEEDYEEKEE